METIFESAVRKELARYGKFDVARGSVAKLVPADSYFHSARGMIDAIYQYGDYRLGFEFKVTSLPRMKNHGHGVCLYDIGQITRDYIRLQDAGMDAAYCIVAFDGAIVSSLLATETQIWRQFHNAMFVDYWQSREFDKRAGWKRPHEEFLLRNRQRKAIEELGLDVPFDRAKRYPNCFCVLDIKSKLGAIGIWVRQ